MTGLGTAVVTGFPGFIASRLVKRLARGDRRFFLVVQTSFLEQARAELLQIAAGSDKPASDFQILEGDITSPNLGLSEHELTLTRTEATTVFHLAAIYDLAVARDVAMRVNVGGTQNVNDFVRSLKNLRHYHYISTCYVAGKREGRILETELRHDAGFRNHYEETKHLAEREVEALKDELPITIHRPSVVCGDSQTGETAKYDGVYYLIRYLRKWPGLLSSFNIGNDAVSLNLVPVDFVVEAIATLATDTRAIGKTIQLADPKPLSTSELFDTIAGELAGHGSRITIPAPLVQFSLMLPPSPRITGLPHHAVPYFFLNQTYDTTQATGLLEPRGIYCPPFQTYVKKIIAYAASHSAFQVF